MLLFAPIESKLFIMRLVDIIEAIVAVARTAIIKIKIRFKTQINVFIFHIMRNVMMRSMELRKCVN